GDGPELKKLKKNAPSNVEFTGKCSRESLEQYYKNARGLIFPGIEDFGIVPVEAQSFGCPVIACAGGGALETVINGKTGVYFYEQTAEAVREAVYESEDTRYNVSDFEKNIKRFTNSSFRKKFIREVENII
ncbi:MAG: glycosyltransferase, partial [Spirochaetia bacterium]|nr:glycosyltransferase [Spirochaetia bacterium]